MHVFPQPKSRDTPLLKIDKFRTPVQSSFSQSPSSAKKTVWKTFLSSKQIKTGALELTLEV